MLFFLSLIVFLVLRAKIPPPPCLITFSPVPSTNVGIRPKNFQTFSFNSFNALVQNLNVMPSASAKLLNLNQEHLSDWGYNNFFHRNTIVTKLWSHDHNIIWVTRWHFSGDLMDRNYDVITFTSKYHYFKNA